MSRRDEGHCLRRIHGMDTTKPLDVIGQLGPLRRYARALTRDEAQADDLVQDALVRALERKATFRSGGNLRGWLLSILHNTFIDERRRVLAQLRGEDRIALTAEVAAPPDQDDRVHLRQIVQAFEMLPEDQRAALHLVSIEGLSYQEAASTLTIPLGTLMSRLGRARAALRSIEAANGSLKLPGGQPRPTLRLVGGSDG